LRTFRPSKRWSVVDVNGCASNKKTSED